MFRIDSEDAVAVLPTPDAAGPISGYFSKGDPGIGQEATVVSFDWMNALQETVIHPIEDAGLPLSKDAPYDLLTQALKVFQDRVIPAGTKMVFYQSAAPTGWTRDTTAGLNDKFIRVVTAGSPGTTGGTHAASTNIGAHTHTGPSHSHTLTPGSSGAWAQLNMSFSTALRGNEVTGVTSWTQDSGVTADNWLAEGASGSTTNGVGVDGQTDSGGTGNTGAASIGTGSYAYCDTLIASKDAY